MLRGRESLGRIVGKRRRFLPNSVDVLSSSESVFSLCEEDVSQKKPSKEGGLRLCEEEGSQNNESMDGRLSSCNEEGAGKNDWMEGSSDSAAGTVNCPVCGCVFPGQDNAFINTHLDECLARGSKRKLSQLTLLQLNFTRSRGDVQSLKPDDIGHQIISIGSNLLSSCYRTNDKKESDSIEEIRENGIAADSFVSPHAISNGAKDVLEDCLDDFDFSKLLIPTVIVGRRYGKREELDPESKIYLIRDPENVKDPNAIKVTYEDSNRENFLGYLPREIAQYLSPLMDKFSVTFEGNITSVPKDDRAAVPVQVACKSFQLCDNADNFKSLWRHVLCAVELAETIPAGKTRYQQNMLLIILEVLESSPVFTTSEKSFLGSFKMLSDDSQRLFARLYTRKGFTFRELTY